MQKRVCDCTEMMQVHKKKKKYAGIYEAHKYLEDTN